MTAYGATSPLFETDDGRLSFAIRLPNHPLAWAGISTTDQVSDQVTDQVSDQVTDQVTGEIMWLLVAAAQGEHTPHFRSQRYPLIARRQRWLETYSSRSVS